MREALEKTIGKRKNDARAAVQVGLGYLVGDNVKKQRLKQKVSRSIDISRKSLGKAHKTRKKYLSGEVECWTYTEWKTRSDAISAEHCKLAHDFWASTEISRVVPNKNTGIVRKCLAPKTYVSHPRHILEKMQTEAFLEFKRKYPDVKMGQHFFEKCKPFYVFSPTQRDQVSCSCRVNVETRLVFKACMEFCRKFLSLAEQDDFVVFDHLSDMAEQTLCPKQEGAEYHAKECLMRQCPNCGAQNLPLMPEEASLSDSAPKVKWQKKKLQLVDKTTLPGEIIACLKELLASCVTHQFRANWQQQQSQELFAHLPPNHACAIHDYSENYNCQIQNEIQLLYFGQVQASIHVTVLRRHALKAVDGVESTKEKPIILSEHIFVISPDLKHDHHYVHQVRVFIDGYLKKIGYPLQVMHERTDGCAAQYKRRHCMGEVAHSSNDFGYLTIRNYYETSHAKGPQDGAGASLKNKADMAVIKVQVCEYQFAICFGSNVK